MARPADQRIPPGDILTVIRQMQEEGFDFSVGRPLKGQRGGFPVLSKRLGLTTRYLQQVLKKAEAVPPSSPVEFVQDLEPVPLVPRTPANALSDLESALNAFVDEAISMEARSFNPALILWAEKGIELLQTKWEP
jgi:hypothetical protein